MDYYAGKIKESIITKRPHTLSIDLDCIIKLASSGINDEKELIKEIHATIVKIVQEIQPHDLLVFSISGVVPTAEVGSLKRERYTVEGMSKLTAGTSFMIKLEKKLVKWIDKDPYPAKVYLMGQMIPGSSTQKIVQLMKRYSKKPLFGKRDTHVIYTKSNEIFLMLQSRKEGVYIYKPGKPTGIYVSVESFNDIIYEAMGNNPTTLEDFTFLNLFTGVNYLPTYPIAEDVSKFMTAFFDTYKELKYPLTGSDGQIRWQNVLEFLRVFKEPEDRLIFPDESDSSTFREKWYKYALGPTKEIVMLEDCDLNFFIDENMVIKMCIEYIYGLEWSYRYIREGPSELIIGWSYPYNHTPLLSDITSVLSTLIRNGNLPSVDAIEYPHTYPNVIHQLTAVTPRRDRHILPIEVSVLLEKNSPIFATFLVDTATDVLSIKKRIILPPLDYPYIVKTISEMIIFSRERDKFFEEKKIETFIQKEETSLYTPAVYKTTNRYFQINESNIMKKVLNTMFMSVQEPIILSMIDLSANMIDVCVFWESNKIKTFNVYTKDVNTVKGYINTLSNQDKVVNFGKYVNEFQDVVYINSFNHNEIVKMVGDNTDLFVIKIGKTVRFYPDKYGQYYIFIIIHFDESDSGNNYIFMSKRRPNIGSMKGIKVRPPKGEKKKWIPKVKEVKEEEVITPEIVPEFTPEIVLQSTEPLKSDIIRAMDHAFDLLVMMPKKERNMTKMTLTIQAYDCDDIKYLGEDDRIVSMRAYTFEEIFNTIRKLTVFSEFHPSEVMKSSSTANVVLLTENVDKMTEEVLKEVDLVIAKVERSYTFDRDRFDNTDEIETDDHRFIFISQNPIIEIPYITPDQYVSSDTSFHGEHLPDFMLESIKELPTDNEYIINYEDDDDYGIETYTYPKGHKMALQLDDRSAFLSVVYFITKYGAKDIDLLFVNIPHIDSTAIFNLFKEVVKIHIYSEDEIKIDDERVIVHDTSFEDDLEEWSTRVGIFLFIAHDAYQWYNILKDNSSMVSAMLDFDPKLANMAGEEIFFSPWGLNTNIVLKNTAKSERQKAYDVEHYQKVLNYINNVVREWQWLINDQTIKGMDYCHDCYVEIFFWEIFLKSRDEEIDQKKVEKLINDTGSLDYPPHGLHPHIKMTEGRREMLIRYSIDKQIEKKKKLYASL